MTGWVRGCLIAVLAGCAVLSSEAEVRCQLALKDGKTIYHSGEPVVLVLSFVSTEPGVQLNVTTTEPPSPIDEVVLSPMTGVFPWMEDRARGDRYSPDYGAVMPLEIDRPTVVSLVVNDLYRFDRPGRYTVRVRTRRASGAANSIGGGAAIATNAVSFQVAPFPAREEAALASSLERQIRAAHDQFGAQRLAGQLDYLAGDAASNAKLSLFLNPKSFYPFGVDVTRGLWIARNRTKIVAALEAAIVDPAQENGAGTGLLETLVGLKLSLAAPYNIHQPPPTQRPALLEEIQSGYLHQIAETIPARSGDAQIDAARTVLVTLARDGDTHSGDFAAAREVLIGRFADVDKYNVDWLLNSYGQYLADPRLLPALEKILEETEPLFVGNRDAALKEISRIAPEGLPKYLAQQACAVQPVMIESVRELTTAATLPEVDGCLREKLRAETEKAGSSPNLALEWTLEYIARFADGALVAEVKSAYVQSRDAQNRDLWTQGAVAAAMVYLMRWDAKESLPLLDVWLPGKDPYGGATLMAMETSAYPPNEGLRSAFRERLTSAGGAEDKSFYPYLLAKIGDESDRQFLLGALTRLRSRDAAGFSAGDGRMEAELVEAILEGRAWKSTPEEAAALRQGCVSQECKERFRAR